ncbi:Mbov_0399 family ICE element protein [Mesomycoplasma lagogenitalium]|uniref:Uncharacterized protein n=1 Tax=Mesomycoplasma lagogenitalium TaxID=171286 RepID=A0ABY8LXD7_9BACT|nr:hypothetical protein [Mesomycoplasma lagogenitalium]WGI36941.1 hypothetical protein QEG99_01505 [Mesomycoplasma lagogenitalium]
MKRKTKFHLLLSTIPIVFTLPFFISANSNNEVISGKFEINRIEYSEKIFNSFSDNVKTKSYENITMNKLEKQLENFIINKSVKTKILDNLKKKISETQFFKTINFEFTYSTEEIYRQEDIFHEKEPEKIIDLIHIKCSYEIDEININNSNPINNVNNKVETNENIKINHYVSLSNNDLIEDAKYKYNKIFTDIKNMHFNQEFMSDNWNEKWKWNSELNKIFQTFILPKLFTNNIIKNVKFNNLIIESKIDNSKKNLKISFDLNYINIKDGSKNQLPLKLKKSLAPIDEFLKKNSLSNTDKNGKKIEKINFTTYLSTFDKNLNDNQKRQLINTIKKDLKDFFTDLNSNEIYDFDDFNELFAHSDNLPSSVQELGLNELPIEFLSIFKHTENIKNIEFDNIEIIESYQNSKTQFNLSINFDFKYNFASDEEKTEINNSTTNSSNNSNYSYLINDPKWLEQLPKDKSDININTNNKIGFSAEAETFISTDGFVFQSGIKENNSKDQRWKNNENFLPMMKFTIDGIETVNRPKEIYAWGQNYNYGSFEENLSILDYSDDVNLSKEKQNDSNGWFGANKNLWKTSTKNWKNFLSLKPEQTINYKFGHKTYKADDGKWAKYEKPDYEKVIKNEKDLNQWIDNLDIKLYNSSINLQDRNTKIKDIKNKEWNISDILYDMNVLENNIFNYDKNYSILKNQKSKKIGEEIKKKIIESYKKQLEFISSKTNENANKIVKIKNLNIDVNFKFVNYWKDEAHFDSRITAFKVKISFDWDFSEIKKLKQQEINDLNAKNQELIENLNKLKLSLVENGWITPGGTISYNSETNFVDAFDKTKILDKKSNYKVILEKQEEIKQFVSENNELNINAKFENNDSDNTSILKFNYIDINGNNSSIIVFDRINYERIDNFVDYKIEKRLKIKPSSYIDKTNSTEYSPLQSEVPTKITREFMVENEKVIEEIDIYYNFPTLEFFSPKEKNEILYINNEAIPIYNNIYKYQFKDKFNDPKTNTLLAKLLDVEKKYKLTNDEELKKEYEKTLNQYQNINLYLIEVKKFDAQTKATETVFRKKILIQSQKDILFNVKFFAWNPNENPEQREIIEQFLKDPKGNYILDKNKNRIPNPKYNPFINSQTGTNLEYVILTDEIRVPIEKGNKATLKLIYNHNNQFILFNPLNAQGEKREIKTLNQTHNVYEITNIYEAHVVYGGIKLELSDGINRFDVWKYNEKTKEWDKQEFYSNNLNFYKNKENVIGDAGLFKIVANRDDGQAKHKLVYIKKNNGQNIKINDEFFSKSIKENSNFVYLKDNITPLWDHYWGKQLLVFLKTKYNLDVNIAKILSYDEILNYWKEFYAFATLETSLVDVLPIVSWKDVKNFMEYNPYPIDKETKNKYREKLKEFVSFPYSEYIDLNIEFESETEIINKLIKQLNQKAKDAIELIKNDFINLNTFQLLIDNQEGDLVSQMLLLSQPQAILKSLLGGNLENLKSKSNNSNKTYIKLLEWAIKEIDNTLKNRNILINYLESQKTAENQQENSLNSKIKIFLSNLNDNLLTSNTFNNNYKLSLILFNQKINEDFKINSFNQSENIDDKIHFNFSTKSNFIHLNTKTITISGNWMKESELFNPKVNTNKINDFYWKNKEVITIQDLNNKDNNFFDDLTYENLEIYSARVNKLEQKSNENQRAILTFNFRKKIISSLEFNDKEYTVYLELKVSTNENPYKVEENNNEKDKNNGNSGNGDDGNDGNGSGGNGSGGNGNGDNGNDGNGSGGNGNGDDGNGSNGNGNGDNGNGGNGEDGNNGNGSGGNGNGDDGNGGNGNGDNGNGGNGEDGNGGNGNGDNGNGGNGEDGNGGNGNGGNGSNGNGNGGNGDNGNGGNGSDDNGDGSNIDTSQITETDFSKMKLEDMFFKKLTNKKELSIKIYENLQKQFEKYFGNNNVSNLIEIENFDKILNSLVKELSLNVEKLIIKPKFEKLSDDKKFIGYTTVNVTNNMLDVNESPEHKKKENEDFQKSKNQNDDDDKNENSSINPTEIAETDFSKMIFKTISFKEIIDKQILKDEIFRELVKQTTKYFGNNDIKELIEIEKEEDIIDALLKPKTLNSIVATLIPKMKELSDGRKFKGSAKITITNDLLNIIHSPFYKGKNNKTNDGEQIKSALESLDDLKKTSNILLISGVLLITITFSSYGGYVLYIRRRKII